MADRVALYLQDAHALRDAITYAQYAEECGFEAVWQAENRLMRDAIVPMAAYAATTERIKIGSGVINNWTRNAALIAATYATLDDLAPGRITCGIGAWWEPLAQQVGIERRKPLIAIRETVTAVRELLAGKRVTFQGEFVQLNNVELAATHDRRRARHVPIYIGATSMAMMALAGEIGDGVLLNYLASPGYNAEALAQLESGARNAGRSLGDIDRPQLVVCSVDRDRKRALDCARKLVTQYLRQQPQIMKASGIRQELLDEIAQALTWPATEEALEAAMRLVPDDVVQSVTASGAPEEVRAKVREYIAAGATAAILYPLGPDVKYMIDVFADGYSA